MGVTLILVLLVSAIIIVHWIWALILDRGGPPNLPGFLPIIGHSYKFLNDSEGVLGYLREIAEFGYKNKGVARLWLGIKPFYVVVDPEVAVLIGKTCMDRGALAYKVGRPITGHGLLMASAPIWKVNRKHLNPAFSLQMIENYITVFNEYSRRLVKEISTNVNDVSIDHLMYAKKFSLETICLNTMGIDISDASQNKSFIKSVEQAIAMVYLRFCNMWLHSDFLFNLSHLKKKQDNFVKIIQEVSQNALEKSKKELMQDSRSSKTVENSLGKNHKKYIDNLLESNAFSNQGIIDEVITILMTGTDTTANVLTYVLIMIGSFPDIQDKIVAEFQTELKNCDEDITWNDLTRLTYLEAVVKETLRFQTLVPVLLRSINSDVKSKHYTLKAGTNCITLSDALHKHPCWGPDVNEFKPERWLNPTKLADYLNAFVAFGTGKRNCIGRTYATAALKITLVHLLRKYRISADYTKMKKELGLIVVPASGYEISIEYR